MPEFFAYDFMIRALLAGIMAAVTLPFLGSFLVARRYSLIADSLAHVSLAGVGVGLLVGSAPVAAALPIAAGGAVLLEWLRQRKQVSGEVGLAILMSGGLAVAVVLANLAKGSNADFNSYLFGSIATTSPADIIVFAGVTVIALTILGLRYRAFLHIAYDEDSARIAGYAVTRLNYTLAILTAAIVVLSLRIVGGLLISALLVMPVVIASRLASSFRQTIFLAIGAALVSVVMGLVFAFYAGIAAGGAIVLVALILLVAVLIWK